MNEQPSSVDPAEEVADSSVTRRDALRRIGGGGLTVLSAGMVVGAVGTHTVSHAATAAAAASAQPTDSQIMDHEYGEPGRISNELIVGSAAGPYGGEFAAPADLDADALDFLTLPPPPVRGPVEVEMTVVEQSIAVSQSHTAEAWTYNGSAPGPIIRATEGETMRVHFTNATSHDHNIHFHGRHSPTQDGWEPIPPGGQTVYEFVAGPAGVHPYHCHTMPIDRHIAKGLYGTLIVDPVEGRSAAHEIVLALSGWDIDDDGRNEVYCWNGIAGFYAKYPIKLPVGDPIRAYVLNMTEFDPITSFHLHAEMFDVYPAGGGTSPAFTTDILTLGQMDRAILEFSFPERGRYMFHPHQHAIAHRGAMGWFSAI